MVRNDRGWSGGPGMGMLRVALLFGSAAVALALIIAPIADSQPHLPTSAGSTDAAPADHRGAYTIRKSVLQPRRIGLRDPATAAHGDC